jgi:DNA-binding SARP family transcriptional activator/tetratricopeptide (TPR) repeat protein
MNRLGMECVHLGEEQSEKLNAALTRRTARPVRELPGGADVEIEFNILGPPELKAIGQETVQVSPQLWCVLTSLLLTPNIPVAAETLIDRLWGDAPPLRASTTIRAYVWRIEKIVSLATANRARVTRQGHGYALNVDPHAVDLHRYRILKRQSDTLAESGETRRAAELLREAESLWRGQALATLTGDWVAGLRASLDEERRAATFRRIELELILGRHTILLAELAELSEQYPLDEDLAGFRMIALFRAGRQTDALRVYRDIRARLIAEGLKPCVELMDLQLRVLRQDSELAVTPAVGSVGTRPRPSNLPADIGDFTGRAAEMGSLMEETGPRPVLRVIEGMGGVGKTVLAVHAGHHMARRYPDAQLYLNLRAYDPDRGPLSPADALRDLLALLGVPPVRIPDTQQARADLWRAELACRRAVLIFDDVADPEQISPLLPATGDSMIIVTSRRHRASWGDAQPLVLPVLEEDDAARLFARVAGLGPDRGPDAAQASRLCGFLPLAIRLTASRVRSGNAAELTDLLAKLIEPNDDLPESDVSQQIGAAFELSYNQLTEDEQRFLRYLAASPCTSVTAHSGAALAGVPLGELRAALGTLANHYLLEEVSPGRFGLHDLIRAFAAEQFTREDSEPEVRRGVGRLADYCLHAVEHANKACSMRQLGTIKGNDCQQEVPFADTPAAATAWLESEWSNALRVAEYCARREFKRRCADLTHALAGFLIAGGHWDEACVAHTLALQACRDLDYLPGIARAAFDVSLIYMLTGRSDAALQHANEAETMFCALDDPQNRAAALDLIGTIHRNASRFRDALAYHQESLDICRAIGDESGAASALVHAGPVLWHLGRPEEEMAYLARALDIFRENGDPRGQALALNNMGTVQQLQGYHRDAIRSYQASHDIFLEIGGRLNLAIADHNIGRHYLYIWNYTTAIAICRKVLATYRRLGDPQHEAYALADIGSAYRSTGNFDEALAHYEKAATMAEQAGDRYQYAEALCGIAEAHAGYGHLDLARQGFERVSQLAGEIESLYLRAKALSGIAETVLHTRGPQTARIYWREAQDIYAQLGVPEAKFIEIRLSTLDSSAS